MPEPAEPPVRSEEDRRAAFEELMRAERSRQPVNGLAIATLVFGLLGGLLAVVFGPPALRQTKERGQRGYPLAVIGLLACVAWIAVSTFLVSTGRTWWQQQPTPPASGLDLKVGDCFDAPDASGEFDVFTVSCSEHHDGEVFAVVALPYDEYPGVVEFYDDVLPRCEAQASTNYAAVASSGDVRVQVMTHTPETWKTRPHRVVCYFHLADERNGPLLG